MKGVISAVIILAMIVVSSFVVLLSISDLMEQSGDYSSFNEAKQLMANLDGTVRSLLFQSSGASADFSMNLPAGEFFVDDIENRFFIRMDTDAVDPQTLVREGPLTIERGPFVSAYEEDVDNDGTQELVLENDAVLFAVAKIGNVSLPEDIDIGNMIKKIKVKHTGFESAPEARLFINSMNATAGTGYSMLLSKGSRLSSSSIKVHVDSGNIVYDAFFTLNAANDYITLVFDIY